jgi:hypothetical protein
MESFMEEWEEGEGYPVPTIVSQLATSTPGPKKEEEDGGQRQ